MLSQIAEMLIDSVCAFFVFLSLARFPLAAAFLAVENTAVRLGLIAPASRTDALDVWLAPRGRSTQLGALLERTRTAEQDQRNVATVPGSKDVVEFAIRLPGNEDGLHVWPPIDSKFTVEAYERLLGDK